MTISSSPSEPIGWQGAAGRTPDRFVVLRVTSVQAEGPGLFGIRRSPSIAGYLPDAHVLEGRAGEQGIRVHLPGPELKGAACAKTRPCP